MRESKNAQAPKPVPYESGIAADGLVPGKTLVVYGTPEKKAKKFNINLLKKNGDIALHFNPRFDEKVCCCLFYSQYGALQTRSLRTMGETATLATIECVADVYL
uniref:Galectin n=2 Tax=Caenorhabditis japonica TaxID=281687 RepID=A0A8R1EIS6_CAEJA